MKILSLRICLSSLLICVTLLSKSQGVSDSSEYSQSLHNMFSVYKDNIGQNSLLFNGAEYVRNGRRAKGYPFWASDSSQTGTVNYGDITYRNVPLRYDLVTDLLIVTALNTSSISLVTGKIKFFIISGHRFIHLDADKIQAGMHPGFYEELYDGVSAVYARHEKKLLFPPNTDEDPRYVIYDNYYIRKAGVYYEVDSKTAVLDVLKDKRDAIKKFIRSENLNFRKQPESALVKAAVFYDQPKP